MQYTDEITRIRICTQKELDIIKTFECGQCFRWNMQEDGSYIGVAKGKAARLFHADGDTYIECTQSDYDEVWHDYLDMDTDYESIRLGFNGGEYLDKCAEFGAGIRILRQDRWEALCSFIISQCNNIPRIKKIVETLCTLYGNEIEFGGKVVHAFPSAERVASFTLDDLAPLRCGYRAQYILDAAKAVASDEIDLDGLAAADCDTAMKGLLSLNGVGAKVASCALLFGLGHMEAFPIDVWMKRALKEHFAPDFDPKSLGDYAGLAQQYIFYYARSGEK